MARTKAKPTPEECEATAREEGWLKSSECTVSDLRDIGLGIAESIIQHGSPEFYNRESGETANADNWEGLVQQQHIIVYDSTFRIPEGLEDDVVRMLRELRHFVADQSGYIDGDHPYVDARSCGAFREPQYQGRFENVEVPETAVAAAVFDGGPLARFMNISYGDYKAYDQIDQFLKDRGFWFENYSHWWAWILRKD